MIPRDLTPVDLEYFREMNPKPVIYKADNEHVDPVQAIVTETVDAGFDRQVRVPWVLDEIDLVNLAKGGTLWFTALGDLPAHYLHVQPPHAGTITDPAAVHDASREYSDDASRYTTVDGQWAMVLEDPSARAERDAMAGAGG